MVFNLQRKSAQYGERHKLLSKPYTYFVIGVLVMLTLMLLAGTNAANAGSLDSPGAPTNANSAMYSTESIYQRLVNGTTGTLRTTTFGEPSSGPTVGTGHTLNDIMSVAPAVDAQGAAPNDVLSGKTFWGLASGNWGKKTGAFPNTPIAFSTVTCANAFGSLASGYYTGTTLAAEASLVTGYIKSGATICGVQGSTNIIDTTTGSAAAAGDILTGKSCFANGGAQIDGSVATVTSFTGTGTGSAGQVSIPIPDGLYSGSKTATASDANFTAANIKYGATIFGITGGTCSGTLSTLGRWCDNGDGTVTDMTTGLIWLKDAGCSVPQSWANAVTWALTVGASGASDLSQCGLNDGSQEGGWRLPTKSELVAITTGIEYIRSSSMYKFINVQSGYYWSSTTFASNTSDAWFVNMWNGFVYYSDKSNGNYVWPVRTGQ